MRLLKDSLQFKDWQVSGIYMLHNLVTDKIYIGQAQSVYKRLTHYRVITKSTQERLKRSLQKHGVDKFSVYLLERVNILFLNEREQYYLDLLKPFNNVGYNINRLAESNRGFKMSEEARARLRGIKKSDTHKKNLSRAIKGRKLSQNWVEKIKATRQRKKVVQLDLSNTIIRIYNSIAEAAASVNCHQSSISAACRKIKWINTVKGYKWEFYNGE